MASIYFFRRLWGESSTPDRQKILTSFSGDERNLVLSPQSARKQFIVRPHGQSMTLAVILSRDNVVYGYKKSKDGIPHLLALY